VNNTRS